MFKQIRLFLNIFKYRLSRRIVSFIFVNIILIETIILIPSYFKREAELLSQLEKISTTNVESLVKLYPNGLTPEMFIEKINEVKMDSVILGVSIYDQNNQLIQILGEKPRLTLTTNTNLSWKKSSDNTKISGQQWDGDKYEAIWMIAQPQLQYKLIVRHNAIAVKKELIAYTIRIIGLIIIISVFVTLMMMIVLDIIIIIPILNLRDDLMRAGENLNKENNDFDFYSLNANRSDELGDVMTAFNQMFHRIYQEINQRKNAEKILRKEQEKSERLLLNILPESIAEQLKQGELNIAKEFQEVTVLFADIVGFTQLSSEISADKLVYLLNDIFSAFDHLTEKHKLEKIKTIGDAYMLVGGLPNPQKNHAIAVAEMALDMLEEMIKFNDKYELNLNIRIGINTGCVVAGVIGKKKFIYDLWGDAVNTASRMESHGIAGKIHLSETTYNLLKSGYIFENRGLIPIKGKGEMNTYLLIKKIE
jgi:adenylate cyclase